MSTQQKEEQQNKKDQQKRLPLGFGQINSQNVYLLKKINTFTFPIKYSSAFYGKVVSLWTKYSRMAYFNDILVGEICCREEEYKGDKTIYIMTISVLEPYRRYHVGTILMEELDRVIKENKSEAKYIYLHMQISNEKGLNFYKSHGFEIKETLKDYYEEIEPKDCYILMKEIQK